MSEATLLKSFEPLATAPGGVARLRELILMLAVQGKLVPQDPKDEPASALLKKIRAEKERLIAEGKIKRDKPLAEIADDEKPFELPFGWEWVRLGEVASYIQRGKGPAYVEKSAFRVISQKCIRWYGLDIEPARFIAPDSLSKYESVRFLQPGDLLWNSTGTGTIGRACLLPDIYQDAQLVADSHVTVVRIIKLAPQYLWRWIQSPYVQDEIEGAASGTTNQIELNTSTVVKHLVPLPPLAEQYRIVSRVEELMKLCDALEEKGRLADEQHTRLTSTLFDALANSESAHALVENWKLVAEHFDLLLDRPGAVDALEQTILQLAVRGLLVPQDPKDEPASALLKKIRAEKERLIAEGKVRRDKALSPSAQEEVSYELPPGWELSSLATVGVINPRVDASNETEASFVQMSSIPTAILAKHFTEQRPWGEIKSGFTHFAEGDVGVAKITPCFENGKSTVFQNLSNGIGAGTTELHVVRPLGGIEPRYVLLFLKTPSFLLDGEAVMTGSAGQKRLPRAYFENKPFPLPPVAEQARIVARVEELMKLCADLRKSLSTSRSTQSRLAEALVESINA